MRGADIEQVERLVTFSLEDRVSASHPLRMIRRLDESFCSMSGVLATSIRTRDVRRFRLSVCFFCCCCECFIRSAASGSWWGNWITTCCTGGLSASGWMRRSGMLLPTEY